MPIKAVGQRGSWFAVVDGDRLPCVHRHWWKGGRYHDPNANPGQPKWDEFIAALHIKRLAILTDDEPWSGGPFIRKGYIAVWEIDDGKIEASDLTFQFSRRVTDLL